MNLILLTILSLIDSSIESFLGLCFAGFRIALTDFFCSTNSSSKASSLIKEFLREASWRESFGEDWINSSVYLTYDDRSDIEELITSSLALLD